MGLHLPVKEEQLEEDNGKERKSERNRRVCMFKKIRRRCEKIEERNLPSYRSNTAIVLQEKSFLNKFIEKKKINTDHIVRLVIVIQFIFITGESNPSASCHAD